MVEKLKKISLYPRLTPSVGTEWVEESDISMLERLALSEWQPEDGTIESIAYPRVSSLSSRGFLIWETGAQYSTKVQNMILDRWRAETASPCLLSMLGAAQRSHMPRLILERGGMIPGFCPPPKIGKIGSGKLRPSEVRSLLRSLKACYEDYWPVEQLANIVEPYAKKTRRRS